MESIQQMLGADLKTK